MRDIGAVEPFAFHDERFGPDRFLDRAQERVDAKHLTVNGVLEPAVIDAGHTIARAENDVDRVVAAESLAEPVWEPELGAIACVGQRLEHALLIPWSHENIEVLRMSLQ